MFYRSISILALIWLAFASTTRTPADERGAAEPKTRDDIYGQGVRETDKRSPQDELAGFHLPDGFVAELVASEPQIAKPLNLAFDAQGQLWVTDTTEYPYPAPVGAPAHDTIKVLRDRDHDGTYETVTTFADGLNIPIGILPVQDGVICFSIPNIMLLRDTDGDGRCDQRKVLLGPFDTTRDTHGMINAIRRGRDGWIYACHGFNNQSHVTAADGSEIHLISGNTFRFREDGSHVEQFTAGQVNPFGMTSDEWGHWYTADCHSKPVTLLVEGGSYESFGRPHDGLGFVPAVMDHLHGSTAICGISKYLSDEFPTAWRGKFFSGNVMTSRINCNRLVVDRDKIRLAEEPDFMTSDDPWFRPVDIQLGTDGALYVADFYNKIIGHYEVRLDHPQRDRTSGRIWRIAYRGTKNPTDARAVGPSPAGIASRANASPLLSEQHLSELSSANATRQHFALERLARANWNSSLQQQLIDLATAGSKRAVGIRVAAIWTLHQHRADSLELLAKICQDKEPQVINAVLGAWADQARVDGSDAPTAQPLFELARNQLNSDVPALAMAGANALGRHGRAIDVSHLCSVLATRSTEPAIVPHAMRIALKRLLLSPEVADQALPAIAESSGQEQSDKAALPVLAGVLSAVPTPQSAAALLSLAASGRPEFAKFRLPAVQLACKQMRPEFMPRVMQLLTELNNSRDVDAGEDLARSELDEQTALGIEAVSTLRAAEHAVPQPLQEMLLTRVRSLSEALQKHLDGQAQQSSLPWQESQNRFWPLQDRARQGQARQMRKFYSSHALGEEYTGSFVSSPFQCPPTLEFWICGHDGPLGKPVQNKNSIRLVLVADGQQVATAQPPRNDNAARIHWDLAKWQGQNVRLECIDGDNGNAYAWLAVEGFSLPELNTNSVEGGITRLARLLEALGFDAIASSWSQLDGILGSPSLSPLDRARLVAGATTAKKLTLAKLLVDRAIQRGQPALVTADLVSQDPQLQQTAIKTLAVALAAQMTLTQQTQLSRAIIVSPEGRQLLLDLVIDGRMALHSLRPIKDLLGSSDDPVNLRLIELSQQASASTSPTEQGIIDRVTGFKPSSKDRDKGKLLYEKNCANCHQLRGAGQLVGPQLDGVGPRGPERLAEDILLPNRNVDKAFRMSSLLTEDDRVVVGLVRELAGGELDVIGLDGKAKRFTASQIASRKDTDRSLMPDNFAELLGDQDLSDLIEFIVRGQ